ncbi:LysR family transcriptional regulator [Amphritea opalescens]|uniref:LysR family transcriptional regulator n=1 Tax=Amphritea opalescens TaxID=2490544 RepID=A0A430KUC2_9GAMM|nr:LysR family transcriptional regulator [Amphritea opalescens]RTE67109.1 LysR family transcriptional regulator [Amphritea opalescens]
MNIKQLQYFLKVAEMKSIAAAARQLDIAQPALSLQISKLEHEVQSQLFSRGIKGVQLTESGLLFEKHVQMVVGQLNRAISDISELEGSPKGKLVIVMNQAGVNLLAMPVSQVIESAFPNVELDLRMGLSYQVVEQLASGEADLAITYEEGADNKSISRELLIREDLYFTTQLNDQNRDLDTIRFKDLVDYEIVTTSEKESLGRKIREYEKREGIELKKKMPYGQLLTSLRFVCEGHCHMILPSSAFFHLEQAGQLKALKIIEPEMTRNVYLAINHERPVRNITLKVIELIKACAYQEHLMGNWRGEMNKATVGKAG